MAPMDTFCEQKRHHRVYFTLLFSYWVLPRSLPFAIISPKEKLGTAVFTECNLFIFLLILSITDSKANKQTAEHQNCIRCEKGSVLKILLDL